jgi:hypothetical protein
MIFRYALCIWIGRLKCGLNLSRQVAGNGGVLVPVGSPHKPTGQGPAQYLAVRKKAKNSETQPQQHRNSTAQGCQHMHLLWLLECYRLTNYPALFKTYPQANKAKLKSVFTFGFHYIMVGYCTGKCLSRVRCLFSAVNRVLSNPKHALIVNVNVSKGGNIHT